MSTWDKIHEALAAGEDPVVNVTHDMLASRVVEKQPKKRGFAPKERIRFSLYSKVPGEARKTDTQRCWNPYCRKRITGRFVCNQPCYNLAVEHLKTALELLRTSMLTEEGESQEDVPNVPVYDAEGRLETASGATPKRKVRDRRGRKPKGYRKPQQAPSDRDGKLFQSFISGALNRGEEAG